MISATLYKEIADLLDYAQDRGWHIFRHVNQMNVDLNNSEINPDNIHKQLLENTISTTAGILDVRHRQLSTHMIAFCLELQSHVVRNYGDVNNFLADNATKVRPTFADVSEAIGYPIDVANIENIS
jgi:hypothetical protein